MSKLSIKGILSLLQPNVRKQEELRRLFERFLDLQRKGAAVEAYAVLQELMARFPRLSEIGAFWVFHAEARLFADHDAAKASESLGNAERLGCKRNAHYYKVRGDIMQGMEDLGQAVADYQRSIDLDPDDVPTLTLLAQALSMSGDERVVSTCREILKKDPGNCYAHILLGWEAVRSGDLDQAISLAEKAELSVRSAGGFYALAQLYHELEKYDTAIDMYLKADELGYWDKGPLYAAVAACHINLGHVAIARQWCERAMKSDPDNEYVKEVWQACNEEE